MRSVLLCAALAALGSEWTSALAAPANDLPKAQPEVANSVGMKLAWVRAGQFLMGSRPGEWGRGGNEAPQRRITIARPFYMSRGETTNQQFLAFIEDTKYDPRPLGEADPMFLSYKDSEKYRSRPPNRPDHPVLWVSWYAACRFCNWLSAKEGLKPVYVFEPAQQQGRPPVVRMAHPYDGGYRLPTEAEWEYAARAGTEAAFSFGDDDRDYADHAYSMQLDTYSGAMNNAPVLSGKPNAWGLHQMHGNVHEWCWDWYAPRYDPNRTTDPAGPDQGVYRVARGGAMKLPTYYGRSAARLMDDPAITRYGTGFRVMRNAGKN